MNNHVIHIKMTYFIKMKRSIKMKNILSQYNNVKQHKISQGNDSKKTSIIFSTLLIGAILYIPYQANAEGHNAQPNYPYFITTQPLTIKNIAVPIGTKLTYEITYFKKGQQNKPLSEAKLTTIDFPNNANIIWGGVPIDSINKFFNSAMTGYSVYADLSKLNAQDQSQFSKLWDSCSDDLGITIQNSNDWSFNKKNIIDVESCSVNYQRYFKENTEQQKFLDQIYRALQNVPVK